MTLSRIATSGLAIAIYALTSPAAFAQNMQGGEADEDDTEFYIEARGGVSIVPNPQVRFTPQAGAEQAGRIDVSNGYLGGGAVGVRFADSVRIEGEIMYRNNSVRSVGVPEFSQANAGDFNSVVLAANAYYDLKGTKLGSAALRPYAGAGLAYIQELDTDIVSPSRSAQFSGNGLGFQLLAGVNLEWESGLRAGIGARWTSLSSTQLTGTLGQLRSDYNPVAVTASVGYRF